MESSKVGENREICKQEIKIDAIERWAPLRIKKQTSKEATLEILIKQENKAPGVRTCGVKNIKHKREVIDEEQCAVRSYVREPSTEL